MIPLDKLKSITHLVTHANCPDGIASALVVKDALPNVKVSFMLYGTKEHRELEPAPGTLFVDFTPYVARSTQSDGVQRLDMLTIAAWIDVGAICLDHHPTAKDIVDNFVLNDLGAFGLNEKNECGAWLAHTEVWRPLCELRDELVSENYPRATSSEVEDFATLAAIRDTWKKGDPRWQQACEQAASLLFWGPDDATLLGQIVAEAPFVGKKIVEKQLSAAQRSLDEGHRFFTDRATQVCMFQGVSTTSDAVELEEKNAEALTREVDPSFKNITRQADLVVGFHYKVDAGKLQLQFSMRSHAGYDCAAFAKAHGGGGHTAAAGFTVDVSPDLSGNPYRTFRLLLEQWEGGQ